MAPPFRRLCLGAMLLVACKHVPRFEVDRARLSAALEQRAAAVVAQPEVDQAFDKLVQEVLRQPGVAAAGQQLMASLGSAPGLKPGEEAILGSLATQPAMLALAEELVHDHPGAGADQIGELASQRVTAITDSPIFEASFDAAFASLLARPDISAAFHRLGQRVGGSNQLTAALLATMNQRMSEARLRQRLQALNGGQTPDPQRATALLLSHAFSDQRLSRFYIDLAGLPVMRQELAAALRDLASEPGFVADATAAVVRCVDDPAFQRSVVDTMSLLLSKDVTQEQLTASLQKLLANPVVGQAMETLLGQLLTDRGIGAIGTRALGRLAAHPDFTALVVRLCDDW